MPLSPSALLALAAACAPDVAPPTLLAVARVESGLDPLAIGTNGAAALRLRPQTTAEAARAARRLISAGENIDLGLGQINARNLAWLGLSVEAAFEPCANLAASARMLVDGYRRAKPGPGLEQQGLRTALSFYNTGDSQRGLRNGYVAKVLAAARLPARPAPQADARPPIGVRAAFVIHPQSGSQP